MEQSTKAYEPGTVAVVTWDDASIAEQGRGKSRIRSARAIRTDDRFWSLTERWDACVGDSVVTDIRPLVVLDIANAAHAVDALRATMPCDERDRDAQDVLVEQIADQIEAQTQPRIPEPEWGEKVIAHTSDTALRRLFVNAYTGCEVGTTWIDRDGYHAAWTDLIDPEAVSA